MRRSKENSHVDVVSLFALLNKQVQVVLWISPHAVSLFSSLFVLMTLLNIIGARHSQRYGGVSSAQDLQRKKEQKEWSTSAVNQSAVGDEDLNRGQSSWRSVTLTAGNVSVDPAHIYSSCHNSADVSVRKAAWKTVYDKLYSMQHNTPSVEAMSLPLLLPELPLLPELWEETKVATRSPRL